MSADDYRLEVKPDTDGGKFAFRSGQIIKLTAILTAINGATIPDGEKILLKKVLPEYELEPYLKKGDELHWDQVNGVGIRIDVSVDPGSPSTGKAMVYVLAWGTAGSQTYNFEAKSDSGGGFNAPYTVSDVYPSVPLPTSFQLKPAQSEEETPTTSNGNFLFQPFYVADNRDGLHKLKNMSIRLHARDEAMFDYFHFFPDLHSSFNDKLGYKKDKQGKYIELETDVHGWADLYVCAAQKSGNAALNLQYRVGVEAGEGLEYIVVDFSWPEDANLDPPHPDPDMDPYLNLDDQDDLIPATIPKYLDAVHGDHVVFYSNQKYQKSFFVGKGQDHPLDPLGEADSVQFAKFGLHSVSENDDDDNFLQYFVIPQGSVSKLSTRDKFGCTGSPGDATPPNTENSQLDAPTILERTSHNVVNYDTAKNGITVRITWSDQHNTALAGMIQAGDHFQVVIYLSGYQLDSTAPIRAVRREPSVYSLQVNDEHLRNKEVRIWFSHWDFVGFGQQESTSTFGTFDALYIYAWHTDLQHPMRSKIFHR